MADGPLPVAWRACTCSRPRRRLPPACAPSVFARAMPSRYCSWMKRRCSCATMPGTVSGPWSISPRVETCGSSTVTRVVVDDDAEGRHGVRSAVLQVAVRAGARLHRHVGSPACTVAAAWSLPPRPRGSGRCRKRDIDGASPDAALMAANSPILGDLPLLCYPFGAGVEGISLSIFKIFG